MPANLVRNAEDEKLWHRAKERAEAEGHKEDWPYVVSIFESMKGGKKKKSMHQDFRTWFRKSAPADVWAKAMQITRDLLEEARTERLMSETEPRRDEKSRVKNEHKSPPKDYPEGRKEYADPENFKYPLDTYEHVRAAISYFSKPKNHGQYSAEKQKEMWRRIRSAAKRHGIKISDTSEEKSQHTDGGVFPGQKIPGE